jgi:2-hydroxychromene-2-carboxylate isomerase
LATAVGPGRDMANRSVSPPGHATRQAAWSGIRLAEPEGRTRTSGGAAVLLHRPVGVHDRSARPAFFFDLACPFSYIAAERVERLLGDVDWVPTPSDVVRDGGGWAGRDAMLVQATALARAARLPLVWPERFPAAVPRALRATAYAAELGAGARFALAASRMAFCGGFDLDEPSVLVEVAAAAGVSLAECLTAAEEDWRDEDLTASAQMLRSLGVGRLPVVSVGERWFDGLHALSEAAAWLRRD